MDDFAWNLGQAMQLIDFVQARQLQDAAETENVVLRPKSLTSHPPRQVAGTL